MYCPRCGQQQVSDEMRFCSRCGLPLGGLIQWLTAGGVPAEAPKQIQSSLPSPRRKRMRHGAKLMFISAVMFPVFLVFSLMIDEGMPVVIPILVFFVGLVLMLYSWLFGNDTAATTSPVQTSTLGSTSTAGALPPAANFPMYEGPGQQVRTAELAQPASVTENTTRLLDTE